MPVAVVIASRGRPERILNAVKDADEKAACNDTVIVACLDNDDTLPQKPDTKHKLIWSVEPREDSLGQKYNRGAALAPDCTALLSCDDVIFSRVGYDQIVNDDAAKFADGYGMIGYGMQPWANISQTIAVTSKMREWIGYFMPPYFPAWWHETWMEELGYYMGRFSRSQAFEVLEVDGRGTTTALRDVTLWAQFFQLTRVLREDIAIRFRTEHNMPVPDFSGLRDYFHRLNMPNLNPKTAEHLEQRYGTNPINDERHNRLVAQAQKIIDEVDRLKRKRDDELLAGAEYRP